MAVLLILRATIAGTELPLLSGWYRRDSTLLGLLRPRAEARLLKRLNQRVLIPLQVMNGLLHVLELLAHLVTLLDATLQLAAELRDHLDTALQLLVCIVRRGCRAWRASCWFFEMGCEGLVGSYELAYAWQLQQVVCKARC